MALMIEGDPQKGEARYHISATAGSFEMPMLEVVDHTRLPIAMFHAAAHVLADSMDEMAAVESDRTLSEYGRQEKLTPLQQSVVLKIAQNAENIEVDARHWEREEVELLKVPAIDPGNTVAAVEDREIRDWWRQQSVEERTKMMERMKTAPGNQRLMIAMLRSPIPQLDHEVSFMREQWHQAARLNNPTKTAEIDVGRKQVDWARRGIQQVAGVAQRVVKLDKRAIAETLLIANLPDKHGLFAVSEQVMASVAQAAKQRAQLLAAKR